MPNSIRCIGKTYYECANNELEWVTQKSLIPSQLSTLEIASCHRCGRLYRRSLADPRKVELLSTKDKGDAYARHPLSAL